MNFSRILVHVDSQPRCLHHLETVAALARRHAARAVGIAGPEDEESSSWMTFPANRTEGNKHLASAAIALERFVEFGRQAFPFQPERLLAEGPMVEAICRYSHFVDLVVLGQPDPALTSQYRAFEGVHQIALHSPRPILLLPCTAAQVQFDRTIVIGWNGSREACRATADALPLLKQATRVIAVSLNPPPSSYVDAENARMTLTGYLEGHGVKSEAMLMQGSDGDAARHLLNACEEVGADILVAGVRHTPAINEWTLQGASAELIRESRTALFMSH